MQKQWLYPHYHLRIRLTLVFPEMWCPAIGTFAPYADAVPLTSALSAYFVHPEISCPIPGLVPLDAEAIPLSSSPACVFLSYPLYILLISSLTHLLCWIYWRCAYILNLLLRAFLCLPQIPSFPAAAPYEAITITGTAPLADINIELLWLITNITASSGGGVNWR